ncbi:MAG: cryptochrome/photolyase family protein [Halobacteriovoraceae bacterium]|nr:cryptochrome/photolyase family protein [Halobacteriovoraceae bacterium]
MTQTKNKKLFITLGNQLFLLQHYPRELLSSGVDFFMAEDSGLCTHFKYHKFKIILFLAAMRNYRDYLRKHDYKVHYWSLEEEKAKEATFWDKLTQTLEEVGQYDAVYVHEIEDKFFEKEFTSFFEDRDIEVHFLKSPLFLTVRESFENYLNDVKSPFMATFYQRQRKDLNILLTKEGKPLGGKWSYDSSNRKKMPKNLDVPAISPLTRTRRGKNVTDVMELTDKLFADHPGDSDEFWLPTTRSESLEWLKDFIDHRLENFGAYQDAISDNTDFLFHSALSPMINMGLLTPDEVVEAVLEAYKKNKAPLNSVEGFIRQLIGWREFVRGIYQNYSEKQEKTNFFNHKRKLSPKWYEGNLGVPPVDDAIKKVVRLGFSHHIERLMILSNFMLLCQIDPKEVHRWFMELYVDSSDWVMGPNVYGMGQFSDGGIFATKPYVSGSNYILKMSHYKKGPWCEVWDGLYWKFISDNIDFYSSNPRMGFAANTLKKMDKERKEKIFAAADQFLDDL